MGHIKVDCWAKGGGKEDQALEWYKLKEKEKEADSAKQSTENNDFAFITPTIQTSNWLSDSAASVHCAYMQRLLPVHHIPYGTIGNHWHSPRNHTQHVWNQDGGVNYGSQQGNS